MDQNHSELFGSVPNDSEPFGTVPQSSAAFGTVRNDAETFRSMRNVAERTENHTLTVRAVARLFEDAQVPRTERSIVNWCRLNRQGVARLDAFFDENEGRYYITPQSVTRAIEEERAKLPVKTTSNGESAETASETSIPKQSRAAESASEGAGDRERVRELERQTRDLEITTRVKDHYIEQLEKERTRHVDRLVGISRYVGELETKLLQLGGAIRADHGLPNASEEIDREMDGNI